MDRYAAEKVMSVYRSRRVRGGDPAEVLMNSYDAITAARAAYQVEATAQTAVDVAGGTAGFSSTLNAVDDCLEQH